MLPSTLFLLPVLASYVSAHGFVHQAGIGGTTFPGNQPSTQDNSTPSVIRQITTQDPVKGATNPDVNCGSGAFIASQVAVSNPGDTLTFDWRDADLGNWPHNTGPLLTYLANCGGSPCSQFDSTQAQWFKISQVGQKPNNNGWFQADIMNGGLATSQIPNNIAPGNYLIRHEIIALHLAVTPGGAEFYPSCTQIRINGTGTAVPSANELVSFPGAYSDTDPGILVPDVFNPGFTYQFPGPPIARMAVSSGNETITPTASPSSTNKPSSPTSGPKVCKLRKSASAAVSSAAPTATIYPRHISRVMRRLAIDGLAAARRTV